MDYLDTAAEFSKCQHYRYTLWRLWDKSKPAIAFIGLNPSTADAIRDDPTIRKCVGFAARWGYGGYLMLNLFGYRTTYPAELRKARGMMDIVGGLQNSSTAWDEYFRMYRVRCAIGAWGQYKTDRGYWMMDRVSVPIFCLRKNSNGTPEHPLYVPYVTEPIPLNNLSQSLEFHSLLQTDPTAV